MATERLPRLQRRILAWLAAEHQRTHGTMAADHRDLVQALGHDKQPEYLTQGAGGQGVGDDHPEA